MPALAAERALAYARTKIGDWYGWGDEGPAPHGEYPGERFDCSGLVWAGYYRGAGYHWQRTTADVQITLGHPVTFSQLIPGDLVQPHPGHIQLYAGRGLIVEAPHTGAQVRQVPLWGFHRAARLFANPVTPHGRPYPGHLIRYGARGPAVRLIQHVAGSAVDGIFGPHTRAAVERFQHAHHLQVDGIVGPHTWGAMFR